MKKLLLFPLVVLILAGCATTRTRFESTWRNPDAQPLNLANRKVAAVFVTRDPMLRRRTEDAMAREITGRGAIGVPSYTFLSDSEVRDRDAAKAKADSLGFAGAVVMRVVGSETHYAYAPAAVVWGSAPYHHLWGGYWGWGWGAVWDPMYLTVDRVVKVETMVYSLEQDQLVWAGVTRTFDPGRVEGFVAELARAVSRRMVRDGLITRG